DVTVLFLVKRIEQFHGRMDAFLAAAAHARPDARRTVGKMLGTPYVHLATPDREISVFSAYPAPGLHVRSNSKVALRRVLEAMRAKTASGKKVKRLGDTDEFKYLRTRLPYGAAEEDGLVYLPEGLLNHLVSPRQKIAEWRRQEAHNHLRMIGHSALLYRTE